MSGFAKLFNTKEHGQIVVIMQANDEDNPEVRLFFKPEGLGICSVAPSFDDSDAGWGLCEQFFNSIDEERDIKWVVEISERFGILEANEHANKIKAGG